MAHSPELSGHPFPKPLDQAMAAASAAATPGARKKTNLNETDWMTDVRYCRRAEVPKTTPFCSKCSSEGIESGVLVTAKVAAALEKVLQEAALPLQYLRLQNDIEDTA